MSVPHSRPSPLPCFLPRPLPSQVAILAGDFLLARASVSLASLRNSEAIMLMSQSLEHLVAGEILQVGACLQAAPLPVHCAPNLARALPLSPLPCNPSCLPPARPPPPSHLTHPTLHHLPALFLC